MKEETRPLIAAMRRGTSAGALAGGVTLLGLTLSCLIIIGMDLVSRNVDFGRQGLGVQLSMAASAHAAIALAWMIGIIFGAISGFCAGTLRAWTKHWVPSVLVGAVLGYLICWLLMWLLLAALVYRSHPYYEEMAPVWAVMFGFFGIIPGVCGAICHGRRLP